MIKVGVIFGGESVEHEVSIITAVQAINYMNREKYDVVPIYIGKDRNWYTGDALLDMSSYKNLNLIPDIAKEITLTKKNDMFKYSMAVLACAIFLGLFFVFSDSQLYEIKILGVLSSIVL